MQVLKLFYKFFFLIFPYTIVNIIYINSDLWKYKDAVYKFNNIPKGIEVANLGSSHGLLSFDYSIENYKNLVCYNMALAQQTLDFDEKIFQQYIENFKEDSTIIICLSPFETNGIPDYVLNKKAKDRYYRFIKPQLIEDFSLNDWISINIFPYFLSPHPLKDLITISKEFSQKTENRKQAPVINEKNYGTASAEERIKQSEKLGGWTDLFPPSEKGREFNLKKIDSIINLAKKHKINTVIVTTPITKDAFDVLQEKKPYYDIYQFYKELEQKYPDTKFLNYLDLFFKNDYLFSDNNHLNSTGAREFSRIIYSDLKKFGYVK